MKTPAHGFTLLELLVAMAASALLLALLAQVSGGLQAAARRVSAESRQGGDAARARQLLRQLLADTLPAAPTDDGQRFTGNDRGVAFTAAPPQALRHLGPVRVRLFEAPDAAGTVALVLELQPAGPGMAGVGSTLHRERLLGGLQSLRFGYAADRRAGTPLRSDWQDAARPPGWVQVTWREAGQDTRTGVALRRGWPGGCLFDPVSMDCKVSGHGGA